MNKKKILFLSHYFPPEVNAPANRTYEHCKEWTEKNDVEITVITNFPNHPDGKIFKGYSNKLIQKEEIDGIQVIRLLTFITANEGFILRSINFTFYMLASLIYVLSSNLKFDIVIATTPQFFCGLAGKYVAKLKGKPFILEIRDLWPESIIAVGAVKNKFLIKFLKYLESGLYKSAVKIISVTRSFKRILIENGIVEDKIEIIYNGVDVNFVKNINISNKNLENYLSEGFIAGYIGTIGMAHSLTTLVEAAAKLKDSNIKFVIIGSGAEKNKIEKYIEQKKISNIRVFGLQPREEINLIISKLNVFIVHLKKEKLFETVIPSKIFEGMLMKKPILLGVNGESKDLIHDAKCGYCFEPENSNQLAEKAMYFYNNRAEVENLGLNGYNYVKKNYNRKLLAEEYYKIIVDAMKVSN